MGRQLSKRAKFFIYYPGLFLYIVILSELLFFKHVSPWDILSPNRLIHRDINLMPFYVIYSYLSGNMQVSPFVALLNVLGNIVIFIPLGVFFMLRRRDKSVLRNVLPVFMVSVLVETIQYALGLGFCDIDDVILNSTGGLIGVWGCKGLALCSKQYKSSRAGSQQAR